MSTFVSYASNFEDVLLMRCFGTLRTGFYVDIGAHHPTLSSVTRAFYDRGWSGINVEPSDMIEALKGERTRDINLHIAVADFEGEASFFVHTGSTATSSLFEVNSPLVREQAGEIVQKSVHVRTLTSVLEQYADERHIHFLKIDAEGAEDAIIRGIDLRRHRPEVIVIESTEPFTNHRRNEEWQATFRGNRYTLAYFDGVNDFWVRKESDHLLDHFKLPVNVLDGFVSYNPALARLRTRSSQQTRELRSLENRHVPGEIIPRVTQLIATVRANLAYYRRVVVGIAKTCVGK